MYYDANQYHLVIYIKNLGDLESVSNSKISRFYLLQKSFREYHVWWITDLIPLL